MKFIAGIEERHHTYFSWLKTNSLSSTNVLSSSSVVEDSVSKMENQTIGFQISQPVFQ